jgi:hypothetical protein
MDLTNRRQGNLQNFSLVQETTRKYWRMECGNRKSASEKLSALQRIRGLVNLWCGLLKNSNGPQKNPKIILNNFKSPSFQGLIKAYSIMPFQSKSDLVRRFLKALLKGSRNTFPKHPIPFRC